VIAVRFRRLRPVTLYRNTQPSDLSKPKRWLVRLTLIGISRLGDHFKLISEFNTPFAIRLRDIDETISRIMKGMEDEAEELGRVLDGGFMCVSESAKSNAAKRR
jgi:hypothetical protein